MEAEGEQVAWEREEEGLAQEMFQRYTFKGSGRGLTTKNAGGTVTVGEFIGA